MNTYRDDYNGVAVEEREGDYRTYLGSIFTQMSLGLLLTAVMAYLCYASLIRGGIVYRIMVQFPYAALILIVAELAVAIGMHAAFRKLSAAAVKGLFYLYAALTGISFAFIFIAYDLGTVFMAFAISAAFFASMAYIGYRTEMDLSGFRPYLFGGLIAVIVGSVIALLFRLPALDLFITYAGLAIFIGITAYDMQKVKNLYYAADIDEEDARKLGTYGAMELYLDFINIFLRVLRILGNRRRN